MRKRPDVVRNLAGGIFSGSGGVLLAQGHWLAAAACIVLGFVVLLPLADDGDA